MAARADTLIELIDVLGEDAVARLRLHFGGTSLYVPFSLPEEHRICRALGREVADKLVAWGGGSRVSVPKSDPVNLRARILQMREEKRTTGQIAIELGLSERHVFRILKGARDNASA